MSFKYLEENYFGQNTLRYIFHFYYNSKQLSQNKKKIIIAKYLQTTGHSIQLNTKKIVTC